MVSGPSLVPLVALALAAPGQPGDGPARAGAHAGTTEEGRPVAIRVGAGGRRASWRIGYLARCQDGTVIRGRYVSGSGTPALAFDRSGRFTLSRTEPAEFRPEGTGRARFTLSGQVGPAGGTGTWRLSLVTPPGPNGRVACTAGPLGWRVGPPSA